MHISKAIQWLAVLAVAGSLSGCAGRQSEVGMTSTRLNAYHANIKRLLFVTELGDTFKCMRGDPQAVFEASFTDALAQCGVVTQFHRHDPLALTNEEQAAIKSFTPDTIMEIRWKSRQTVGGCIPVSSVLTGSMIDWATKRQVWKAEITLAPAYHAGETLAASIVERLKKESTLDASCPIPVIPPL